MTFDKIPEPIGSGYCRSRLVQILSRTNVHVWDSTVRGLGVVNSSRVSVDVVGGCFCVVRGCLRRSSEGKARRSFVVVAVTSCRHRSSWGGRGKAAGCELREIEERR